MFSSIPHALFSVFFPDDCRLCKQSLTGITRFPVCSACISRIKPLSADVFCSACRTPFVDSSSLDESGRCSLCLEGTQGFDAAYCFGAYEGDLRDLIHLFKYARIRSLERPLSKMLSAALPRDEHVDVIVPVPMHWLRQWKRGFNQAERIARYLSRSSGLPLVHALERSRKTPSQAGLTSAERRDNLAGVFRPRRGTHVTELTGRRVLLVDDVFTTGATAAACAKALKKAGASSVVLLTLARVDRRWAESPSGEKFSGAS